MAPCTGTVPQPLTLVPAHQARDTQARITRQYSIDPTLATTHLTRDAYIPMLRHMSCGHSTEGSSVRQGCRKGGGVTASPAFPGVVNPACSGVVSRPSGAVKQVPTTVLGEGQSPSFPGNPSQYCYTACCPLATQPGPQFPLYWIESSVQVPAPGGEKERR